MNPAISVLYYQPTLGPAHFARVRALGALPGVRCRGVELASKERSRDYAHRPEDAALCDTLVSGVYEELPRATLLRAAAAHLARVRPDAVILDAPADPLQRRIARAARRIGALAFTRWASTGEDYERRAWREFLKGFVYRGWDGYLVTGTRARAYLEGFGVPAAAIHVCGNPVDAAPIEAARLAAPDAPREPAFLFVGRFLRLKNLPAFVRAYARYRAEGGTWGLRLVGFGEDEVPARAAAAGLDRVEWLGSLQLPALIALYLRCGALVLPSTSENWGLVVNEAMHAGLPVIVSRRCGCHPELIEEGVTGLGMDPGDPASMSAALHAMESLGDAGRAALAARALDRIAAHGPGAWAARVRDALAGALAARGEGARVHA